MAGLWGFALEARAVRNGPVLRRFGAFMLTLAAAFTWFNLIYFDGRYNVLPWVDLGRLAVEWNWVVYGLLIGTLGRLWLALRRR
jgi:hypothetical protein